MNRNKRSHVRPTTEDGYRLLETIDDRQSEIFGLLHSIESLLKETCRTKTDFKTPSRISHISKKTITWLNEEESANILGFKPRAFRLLVKSGKLSIAYSLVNGRNYKYSKEDIQRCIIENSSTIV